MDDINFDELDKAVNTALQQTTPKEESTTGGSAVVPSVATVSQDEPVAEQTSPKPLVQTPPKPRGQFMDMVHPSSDMIKPLSTRPGRQGATIQPLSPSVMASEPPVSFAVPALPEEPAMEAAQEAEPTPEFVTVESKWPDPLDVMQQKEDTDSEDAEETNADPQESHEEASGSPFISGTEFEKRPLGAFTNADTAEVDAPVVEEPKDTAIEQAESPEDVSDNTAKNVEQVDDEPQPFTPVPEELSPEVVQVESDNMPQTPLEAADASDDQPTPEVTGMATSISQQYQNLDISAEENNDHPVFDTKEYHQPLIPPAKHGHAGVVVLVIVLLALLGAGAWYAVAVLKLV